MLIFHKNLNQNGIYDIEYILKRYILHISGQIVFKKSITYILHLAKKSETLRIVTISFFNHLIYYYNIINNFLKKNVL